MSNFQLSAQADPNKIFLIKFSEVFSGRLDPKYYKPFYKNIEKRILEVNNQKLGEVLQPIQNGSTPKGGQFHDEGIVYYRSQDFDLFDIRISQFITQDFDQKMERSRVYKGDVLLAVVGATLGKVGYLSTNKQRGNINQNIARLRSCNQSILNSKYLSIFLYSDVGQSLIERQATITAQPYLNNEELAKIKIPIPPKAIQNEIIAIMDTAYQSKQQKEQQAKTLLDSIDNYLLGKLGIDLPKQNDNSLKTRIFTKKFSEVFGGRFDAISAYMQAYEKLLLKGKTTVVKLKEVVLSAKTGSTPHKELNPYVNDSSIPFLRNTNIGDGFLDFSNVKFIKNELKNELTYSYKDDVIICIAGTVGTSAVNTRDFLSINQNITALTLDKNKINPEFLNYYFNTDLSTKLIKRQCSIATILYINNDNLLNLYIPLPPLPKQTQIVNHISQIRAKAKQLQSEAKEVLKQAKQQVEQMILGGK